MVERFTKGKVIPEDVLAHSPLIQKTRRFSETELLQQVGELLGLERTPLFEELDFPKRLATIRGMEAEHVHLLAICVELLERKRDNKTTTRNDLGKFIGMSVLDQGVPTILKALPPNMVVLVTVDAIKSQAGKQRLKYRDPSEIK